MRTAAFTGVTVWVNHHTFITVKRQHEDGVLSVTVVNGTHAAEVKLDTESAMAVAKALSDLCQK
jgi:hypothetical protein